MTILHLAYRSDWESALESGEYRMSTRGATLDDVGFIHASYPGQLARTAELFYADDDRELCVLVLDETLIRADGVRVIEEDGGSGELFPHVYGAIKPSWVVEVRPAGFDELKRFQFS
ncbi:DUF952 domain-containing protein [Humibacter antri]